MAAISNVQAIVARRTSKSAFRVLLFRIDDAAMAKSFLRAWLPYTPDGAGGGNTDAPEVHFSFRWSGLAKLLDGHPSLAPATGIGEFEAFFTDPTQTPERLAEQLGFLGRSAPEGWWDGRFGGGDIDLAVYCAFDDSAEQQDVMNALQSSAAENGLHELRIASMPAGMLAGCRPADGRLHFGYRDGITSPDIGWDGHGASGHGTDLREFVLGYPSEDYPVAPQRPGPWQDFARDGSFLGLTWLYQDVAAFNDFLQRNATAVTPASGSADPEQWLAAKLMGRWQDGSPLIRHPDQDPAAADLDDDFGYAADPGGACCPLSSHIRLAYARDQPMTFPNQVRFPQGPPRLIRRGFSYGSTLRGTQDDGELRGVVGLFLFSRVNEQFYTVLRWMQQTQFSDAFDAIPQGLYAQDAITGSRLGDRVNTNIDIPREDGTAIRLPLPSFIQYRGVAVFFLPSLSALRVLSAPPEHEVSQ